MLGVRSPSGLWQLLRYFGISYQRARSYIHSPDLEYDAKCNYLLEIIARHRPGKVAVLFEDELTYYNHASPAADYATVCQQPKAGRAIGSERCWRAIAALDAFTGAVISSQGSRISIPKFVRFLEQVREAYSEHEVIYMILDNWPVHFHPDVLSALVEQEYPFSYHLPRSWLHLKPTGKYSNLQLPIQLIALPTYASWLNPTEKVWRTLKQQRIHNHSLANNFKELTENVDSFLQNLSTPSRKTRSMTGLLNPQGLFAEALVRAGAVLDSS